jgi:hypothetical protein
MEEATFMPIIITKSATRFSAISLESEFENYIDWGIRRANVTDKDNGGTYEFSYDKMRPCTI